MVWWPQRIIWPLGELTQKSICRVWAVLHVVRAGPGQQIKQHKYLARELGQWPEAGFRVPRAKTQDPTARVKAGQLSAGHPHA